MIDEETIRLQEILKYTIQTNITYNQEALLFIINSKGKLVIYTTSNVSDMKKKIDLFNHNKVISPNDIITLDYSNFIEYMNNEYYQKPRSNLVLIENELKNTELLNKVHQIIVPQNNNNLNFVNYFKQKTVVDENFLISPDQSSKENRLMKFINSKEISKSKCFKCLKKKDYQIKIQKNKLYLNNKRIKVDTNKENEFLIKTEVIELNEISRQDDNNQDCIIDNNYSKKIINDEYENLNDNLNSKSFTKLENIKEMKNKITQNQQILNLDGIIDSANNTISTIPPVITKSTNNTVFSMLKDIKSLTKNQTNELKKNLKPKLKILNDSYVNDKKGDELLLNKSKNVLLKVYDKFKQVNNNNKDETCLSDASDNTFIDNLAILNYQKENDISPLKNNNIMPRKQTIEENLVPKKLLNHSKFGGNNNQMTTGGIFTKNSNVFLYQMKAAGNEVDASKLDNPS